MNLNAVEGHDLAINILLRQIRSGFLASSYLFWGNEGIGKRLVARFFAMALNCKNYPEGPCREDDLCVSCSKISRGVHSDIKEIYPEGETLKKEQVKEIMDTAEFRPFEGRKRVFIIDSAHKMNKFSANALLKTLEEPPEEVIFILISPSLHHILPTIQSRCQKIRFKPIPTQTIANILISRKGMERTDAHLAASCSQGSVGKALLLDLDEFKKERDEVLSLLFSTLEGDEETAISSAGTLFADKEKLGWVLDIILSWYRDLAVYKASGSTSLLINKDKKNAIEEMLEKNEKPWESFFIIFDTLNAMERHCNVRLALEVLFLELLN